MSKKSLKAPVSFFFVHKCSYYSVLDLASINKKPNKEYPRTSNTYIRIPFWIKCTLLSKNNRLEVFEGAGRPDHSTQQGVAERPQSSL